MTDRHNLRDKIARALYIASDDFAFAERMAKAWDAPGPHGRQRWFNYADAVLAVLDDVRAEAWDEGYDYRTVEYRQYEEERVNPYRKEDR